MLYGVSEKYKERCVPSTVSVFCSNSINAASTLALTANVSRSANCRLELNYGSQVLDDDALVPLMMQDRFRPTGWLGLILGTKTYYAFHPAAVDSDEKFMQQMDALTREGPGFTGGGPPRMRHRRHVGGMSPRTTPSMMHARAFCNAG